MQLFTNNAVGSLASGVNATDNTLVLVAGDGAKFPAITGGDFFLLTLTQSVGLETSWEIVKCTARSGDSLTVVRAQEGTAGQAWAAGSKVDLRVTAGTLEAKEPSIPSGTTTQYLRGDKTWQTLNKSSVGLGNVDNTSDADKPVSTATQTALNEKIGDAPSDGKTYWRKDASWLEAVSGSAPISRSERTSNTKITAADLGKFIDITSGTFDQEFDAPSVLGAGWWCYLRNSGAGDIGMPTVLGAEVVPNGNVDQYGANVVVNGTFDADTNWTKGAGWTISGGKAVATATTGNLTASVAPLVAGTMYRVTFDCTVTSGTFKVLLGWLETDVISASGTYTVYGTANSTALVVDGVSAFTGTIDNIVVQPLTGWQYPYADASVRPTASSFVMTSYPIMAASNALRITIPAMTAGAIYDVTYTVTRTAGDIRISFQDAQELTTRDASGTYTERIAASAAHTQLHFKYVTSAFTGTISAISIKKVTGAIDSDDGDGLFVMYPGEARLVQSDGSALRSLVLNCYSRSFTLSGVFFKPPGYSEHRVDAWGGGGNGPNINGAFTGYYPGGSAISGGSGGGYAYFSYQSSALGAAENVVVGGPAGSSTFKNTVAGGGVSATTLVSAALAGGTSDGLTNSFFNGAATNSPNSVFGGAAAGYSAPNEGSGAVYVTNWPTLPTGWSYSSNTLTKDSATAQNAAAGSIAVTAGNLCFFQFLITSSGTGNRYYTVTLSGAASKTFSVSSNSYQGNAQIGYFIAASGTLNISVSGPDMATTGSHSFSVVVKNTPAFTGSIPGGTSKYAGNGGSYSTTNESATMGGFPGGGGAAYASAGGGGNWGKGASGLVRITGVV